MNIQEAKNEIRNTIRAYTAKNPDQTYRIPSVRQRPVLLIGPPGIGKTAIMEQISEELGIGLVAYTITHHTRQSAIGLPVIREREFDGKRMQVTEYTMSEIIASVYNEIERTGRREGILFIDEINCVSETLAPAMLEFLQCKRFGSHQVPPGWVICAAGNPPGFNRSVREFDVVTLDRVRLLNVEENLEVFRTFAVEASVHPAILSFLELKPQNFYRMENQEKGTWFVTARGWEDLSDTIKVYEDLEMPITQTLVEEFLQFPMIAAEFYAFYGLFKQYSARYSFGHMLEAATLPEHLKEAGREERISAIYLLYMEICAGLRSLASSKQTETVSTKEREIADKIEQAFRLLAEFMDLKQLLLKLLLSNKKLVRIVSGRELELFGKEVEVFNRQKQAAEYEELVSRLYEFLT